MHTFQIVEHINALVCIIFICAVLWSVTLQSVPWLRQRHQSGSMKYVNTYTLWISLPAYQFGMNSLAMDIRRFLKRPSIAFTHTDARRRSQVQSKTEEDQFTFLNVVVVRTTSH